MKLFKRKKEKLFRKFEKLNDEEKKLAIGRNNRTEIRSRERGITEPDRYPKSSEEFGKRELLPIPKVSEDGKGSNSSGKNTNGARRIGRIKRRFQRR